jgi:hypothetical protein
MQKLKISAMGNLKEKNCVAQDLGLYETCV